MACRIPGCGTKYWDKNNKLQMYTPDTGETLVNWQQILERKYGITNFGPNDHICILHFDENAIERSYKKYFKGGSFEEVQMKRPRLCFGAVPSIFPDKIPRKVGGYSTKIVEPAISLTQKELFEGRRKEKSISLKRKSENEPSILEGGTGPKVIKLNDMFKKIVNDISSGVKPLEHLRKPWVLAYNIDGSIVWSLWKEDRSSILKTIIVNEDLTVKVLMEAKEITLQETKNIVDVSGLNDLFTKVERLLPCIKFGTNASHDDCLGFVVPCHNGKRVRCPPCLKNQNKLRRKMSTEAKNAKCKIKRNALRVKCKSLSSKAQRLKATRHQLTADVENLKKKCAESDINAINKKIEKLSFSEQSAVRCCFEASKKKNLKGMRYTTQWIYECLLLNIKSPKAYTHIRKRRILVLPHPTTLKRYVKHIAGCYGFQSSIFNILTEKTKVMQPDETRGVLLLDEMKLAKSLAFNRRNLKLEGFTNLGQYTPENQKGKKGDHALVLMYQPFKGKWVQALGCFLSTGSASGTVLHQLIIECIVLAERAGLRVDAVTTDGATWNRKMWSEFGVTKEKVSVPHVVDDKRSLWFISDFPHLIKNLRNFFTHAGRSRDTGIWTPDGIVSLSHWYALLKIENERAFNLKVNFKLKTEHLEPKYFQKMNVALAFQFFGVADSMELFKDLHPDLHKCEPSIILCRKVKALITAMNSRTPVNNLKPGNEMWQHIESFITYLDKWEEEAKKAKYDFISDSTCYGLQISLRAALEICRFLVDHCNFAYLMTARLNQDSLERFFGLMRDCCGSNDHPDSNLFIQMYRLVCTYSLVKPPKGSNITGGEILDVLISLKDITDADARWEQWIGQIDTIVDKGTRCDQLFEAAEVLQDHDYFTCTTSDYVLTYIAGFVARKANKFIRFEDKTPCEECHRSLELKTGEEIPETHKLIQLKSYGYLKHPSDALFKLISILECATLKTISQHNLNAETLFQITETVELLPSTPYVGCKEHEVQITHRIITFFLTTRMFFICKQANKNNSIESIHIREKRKLSKLPPNMDALDETASTTAKKSNSNVYEEIPQECKTNVPAAMKPKQKRKRKAEIESLDNVTNKQTRKRKKKTEKENDPDVIEKPKGKGKKKTVNKSNDDVIPKPTPKRKKKDESKSKKNGIPKPKVQTQKKTERKEITLNVKMHNEKGCQALSNILNIMT